MQAQPETAYPCLKPDPTPAELERVYAPTASEMTFVTSCASRPVARLAVLLHLKTFQRLGYFILIKDIPERIRRYVAQRAGWTRHLQSGRLEGYDTSGSKRIHLAKIRAFLNVKPMTPQGRTWLRAKAVELCQTFHNVPDLINAMLDRLVHDRWELPGLSTLEVIAIGVREEVHTGYLSQITEALSAEARQRIDSLLLASAGGLSGWNQLKRESRRPTHKQVRAFLHHVTELQQIADLMPPIDLPAAKQRYFHSYARSLDVSEIRELQPVKRYALAAIHVQAQRARAQDDVAEIFIKLMRGLENTASERLLAHQIEHTQRADQLIAQLRDIIDAYAIDGTDTERMDAIAATLTTEPEALRDACDAHLAFAGKNFIPFLLKPYAVQRALLYSAIDLMMLRSSTSDTQVVRLIGILQANRYVRSEYIDPAAWGIDVERDLDWLSDLWRRHVVAKKGSPQAGLLHRKYLELAVLFLVQKEIKSGDLYVRDADTFIDPREQLVDDETLDRELPIYGEVSGVPTDGKQAVALLRKRLTRLARLVDKRFRKNPGARMVDGKLVISRLTSPKPSEALQLLDQKLNEAMPIASIVDVLIDTVRWLKLHKKFRPLSGTESQIDNLLERVVTLLLCYGCNLGPTQTARSVRGLSRKQIAWLNLKYVDERVLDEANRIVINAYNKYALPNFWGDGSSASADGTQWSVYPNNLQTEYHIRYGSWGGIGYYHVSDKMIALHARFTTCGSHESNYILDALLENESDIQPDTLHGDTHAQALPVFALSWSLAIKLMPRIRNVGRLAFAKPDKKIRYRDIDPLFTEVIDWDLIERHYRDIMRVVVSVKLGLISSSTILRRLGTPSRKNKVYYAFRELGKAVRTLFLLRYIDDEDLRRTIHAATNNSEQFNGFLGWAFFGGDAIIAENLRDDQRKVVKYNQLVANLVILFNCEHMTRILADMIEKEEPLTPELLSKLSPFRTQHINRFGDYLLDLERKLLRLDYSRALNVQPIIVPMPEKAAAPNRTKAANVSEEMEA